MPLSGLSLDLDLTEPEKISTGTPLDAWFGGVPARAITVVEAPVRGGKTLLLREIARNVSTSRPVYLHSDETWAAPRPSDKFQPLKLTAIWQLALFLQEVRSEAPLILIDDASEFKSRAEGRTWADIVRGLGAPREGPTLVLAWRSVVSREVPTSLRHGAQLMLKMHPLTYTTGSPETTGLVVGVSTVKSRGEIPDAARNRRLWFRPENPQRPVIPT